MMLRLFTLLSACIVSTFSLFGAYNFKEQSVLAEGKWVKIETPETGLYSISYAELKEMGFQTPENVGVYGKGGRMMNIHFSPTSSTAADGFTYSDDLTQVRSLHSGGQIIFWAEGIESVTLTPGSLANRNIPYFTNSRQNIYSKTAYYFLSDCQTPEQAQTYGISPQEYLNFPSGWGYVRHERDLEQNSTNTGNLFWGESFLHGNAQMKWEMPVTNMTAGTGHLVYQIFSGPGDRFFLTTSCNDINEKKFDYVNSDTDYFFPLQGRLSADPYKYSEPDTLKFRTAAAPSVKVEFKAENIDASFLNIDYWILTYPKEIVSNPLSDEKPSELYHFKGTKEAAFKIPLDSKLLAFDITDPQSPMLLPRIESDPDYVAVTTPSSGIVPIVFFDPASPQKKIADWKTVTNNNLHAQAADGAELLIITVPRLREYAERLADLHRNLDGIKVIVATAEEVYNEFSGGVPDPMAYRAIVKMYHPYGLKNLLLFGPGTRNMLAEVPGETDMDHLIAMQHSYVKPEDASVPIYDFYGIVKENPAEATLHVETKAVGVGLLSCETPDDCERILRKIGQYLSADYQAWTVNETLSIGGLGNEHLHDSQAVDTRGLIYTYAGTEGMAHNTLIIDAHGETEARRLLRDFLGRGKIWNIYFGHGTGSMLGYDSKFFTTGDLLQLRNTRPGFIFLGGCDFSTPDLRVRGIGESFVLDTDYGMIGAIVSSRTAWASQNKYLGDKILESWLKPTDKNISPTIGEIFAKAKSGATALNHLSFVLAGDPALRVPSPLRKIGIKAPEAVTPGEKITVEGTILIEEDVIDANFNGKVVLKLMEPAITLRSRDYATNTCNTPVEAGGGTYYSVVDVPYESTLISAAEATVTDGKFAAEFIIPASTADFSGQTLNIKAGAFDKSRWLGGAGIHPMEMTEREEYETVDTAGPAVYFSYDNSRSILSVTVTDENALSLDASAYIIMIDEEKCPLMAESIAYPGETGKVFDGYVSTCALPIGKHDVILTAVDIAGNKAEAEFSFEKTPAEAPLTLTLDSKVGVEKIGGEVTGDYSGSLIFEIRDAKGETVSTFTGETGNFSWDLIGIDGHLVPNGYYRISVRSASCIPLKYSDWVEFAVL